METIQTVRKHITLKKQAQCDIIELRRNYPILGGVVSVIDHALAVARIIQDEYPTLYHDILLSLEEEDNE